MVPKLQLLLQILLLFDFFRKSFILLQTICKSSSKRIKSEIKTRPVLNLYK
jgi:hypothetical protein